MTGVGMPMQLASSPAALDVAPEAVVEAIMLYLTGRDLGLFSVGSRRCRDVYATEAVWESVVRRRWFMPTWTVYHGANVLKRAGQIRPKMLGAATWARAYREAERRITPPRTWMTTRQAKIVAKGRSGGCAMWATVSHARDCRTTPLVSPTAVASLELRVLVQNVGVDVITLRPRDLGFTCVALLGLIEVTLASLARSMSSLSRGRRGVVENDTRWLCCASENDEPAERPGVIFDGLSTTVLAHSKDATPNDVENDAAADLADDKAACTPLELYEWVAFAVRVACPDCAFEVDFLERAISLSLPVLDHGGPRAVTALFSPPEVVHRWYTELPGGFVVLATS